jgi:hypothetical protein
MTISSPQRKQIFHRTNHPHNHGPTCGGHDIPLEETRRRDNFVSETKFFQNEYFFLFVSASSMMDASSQGAPVEGTI